ncbi:uncharacterized protein K02A2.6 [Trichonephila clavipes]|nr:uncharacterized protein K02A2.6 [Trichonephila clavipes]
MGSSNIRFESYDASVEDWSSYVERLESYFVVNGIEDKMKVPAILSLMGATTYKLLKNLATPNIPSELTYQDIVKLLSEHLNPKPQEMTERFCFYERKQFEESNGIEKKLHSSQDKTIKKDFSKFKKSEPTKKFDKSWKCYRCDSTQHLAHECKHKNTQCRNCLKNGNLAKVCRSKRNETVKQIESCSETVPVNSVKSPRYARDKILLEIFVEGNKCLFELNTGAAISCMNVNEFKKLCPDVAIKPTKLLLKNFDNSMITSAGQAVAQIQYKDQINTEMIYLVHAKVNAVFGREWLRNFQLDWSSIKAVRVENCNSRTNKLNILLQNDWATPIVPVIKQNGNLRICGDYKVTINSGLKIEQYLLPRIEDIFAELSGGEFFTKIDLSEAYLQMLVDEQDRHLLTINTHKGLFRYKRMNYGIALAPAVWQRAIEQVLSGIAGLHVFLDDITVTGRNDQEHFERLELVLQRLEEYGFKVNKRKSEFFKKYVNYCGHTIDKFGLHKTQEKIDAIMKVPVPKTVSDLKSFLGLVNYYGKFIPNLSPRVALFNNLLQKVFSYTIKYRNTKNHGNADALSWLPLAVDKDCEYLTEADVTNISQVELMPVTATDIARVTKTDRKLFELYESLKSGTELPVPWKGRESEFSLQNGCIMYGHRVCIPQKYQNHVLEELHVGHPGIVKMKAIARSYCYWQVSDAYSKWIEVIPMKNITASFTIHHLRILFAHYGIPLTLVSDNGASFTSYEFRHFLKLNNIKHITSAPYHAATNGQAERIVQLFKASLKSSRGDSGDLNEKLQRFLLQYRITPHSLTGETLSALFLKRCIRTRLDLFKPNLRDKVVQKQSSRLDTESILREFQEGEKVAVRNYSGPNKWKIGTIINRDGTLSYSIQIGNEIWKRHVDQIKKYEPVSDDVAESEPSAPVPEVAPKPKDVPVPATPSEDIPPKPVPDASGKPKTDVPLRRSNRIRRPPKRLDLRLYILSGRNCYVSGNSQIREPSKLCDVRVLCLLFCVP